MKVIFTPPIDKLRGMVGGRQHSTRGFAISIRGSQTFNRRTPKGKRLSEAEVRGKRTMEIILHAFSHLTKVQRSDWHGFRNLIKREWPIKSPFGEEQTHPKDITYSDLDFFVACNHHLVLTGGDPILSPTPSVERPAVQITGVWPNVGTPENIFFETSREDTASGEVWAYAQGGVPFRSPQRHWRENDYWMLTPDPVMAFFRISRRDNVMSREVARYMPLDGKRWSLRLLLFNAGYCPYGYISWSGVV